MTTRTLLLLTTLFAWQQPQQPGARSAAPPTRAPASQATVPSGPNATPAHKTGFDTTAGVIVDVARAVAEVKAELDRFRVTAANDPNGALLQYAENVRARCAALAAVSTSGNRVMCRHCIGGGAQPGVDQFHAYLPTLTKLGNRCAADVLRLRGRGDDAGASALRRSARGISDYILAGMRGYEAHLAPLLSVLGGRPLIPVRRPAG